MFTIVNFNVIIIFKTPIFKSPTQEMKHIKCDRYIYVAKTSYIHIR